MKLESAANRRERYHKSPQNNNLGKSSVWEVLA
jgi:hypothetical protein